ncbi:MAG TPA: hypothetical protein VE913_12100 [Longimicrobium sp.]|nr:hypothetical protein [Longimicrobium sp.]
MLRWLCDLSVRGGGRVIDEVGGWADPARVEGAVGRPVEEALRCLRLLGYVDCIDGPATRLYRATPEGARYIAGAVAQPATPRLTTSPHPRGSALLTSGG